MIRSRGSVRALALACLFASSVGAAEFEVPALRAAVTDRAGILSEPVRQQLEAALQHLHSVGGTQIAILTVPDLAGLTIEQAAIRVADAWQLGSQQADDGVLLLVAPNERRVRIEVGQGLEGDLTDAYSKRIIDESITPLFREGDLNAGIVVGVYQIARITNPEVDLRPYLEGRLRSPHGPVQRELGPIQLIFLGLLILVVLSTRLGFLPFLAMGGAGGFHGRRSAGGFGRGGFSGGGGGFSGGGASGGW